MEQDTTNVGFSDFVLGLGGLYRDIKVAENAGELAAYQTLSNPTGAEAVPDSEAEAQRDVSGDGVVGNLSASLGVPSYVVIGGAILAVVGLTLVAGKLVK